jgi:ParB family chromosome partitioning protein
MLGLHEVPVIIKEIDDRSAMAIALIENIQREDLNALEEAEAIERLLTEFAMTHQQVADAIGKSRATVTNLLRLLDLQSDLKKMLINKQIEMGHARALLALSGDQQLEIARIIINKGLSVRLAEKLIKDVQAGLLKKEKKYKVLDSDVLNLQNELSHKFGARVLVESKDNGSGRLVIHYTTLDELDGILSKITL